MNDSGIPARCIPELFRELDTRALDRVLRAGTTRQVAGGTTLLSQGDRPDHLFLVERGRFKMTCLSSDGRQKTLRFMEPGDIIGCAAVFRRIPYPATATATTNSVVVAWTGQEFDKLVQEFPQLSANALGIVGGRTEEVLQRLQEVTTQNAEQRIARAIIRLVKQSGLTSAGEIAIRLSRQELAELSDTSLFTASRAVSAWGREGILQGGRGRVRILDWKRLLQVGRAAD